MKSRGRRVIIIALLMDLAIAGAKFAGALITKSASLMAEAIHSFVDSMNELVLYWGDVRSLRPPTPRHPIGHGRESFFWGFVVALLLFSVGGLFSIHEGIDKIRTREVTEPILSFVLIAFSMGVELVSYRTVVNEIRRRARKDSVNLIRWFRRSTSSDLLVIFTDDVSAILGLFLAAAGIAGTWITGNPVWDGAGSIAIGAVLIVMAFALAKEIKSLIIGEVIPEGKLISFIAVQTGVQEAIVNCKISTGRVSEVGDLLSKIAEIEKRVKMQFPQVRMLFVEPAVTG